MKDNVKRRILISSKNYIKPEIQDKPFIAVNYFMDEAIQERAKLLDEKNKQFNHKNNEVSKKQKKSKKLLDWFKKK